MKEVIVSEYGRRSIIKYKCIEQIREITYDNPRRKILVVSAPDKEYEGDIKVTDLLTKLAENKNPCLIKRIIIRYRVLGKTYDDYSYLSDLLDERLSQPIEGKRYLDSLQSFGEEACAKLIAKHIEAQFVDPKDLFLVSEDYGNAKILPKSEEMIKNRLSDKEEIFVIPGFYGYTEKGNIARFGQDGFDIAGVFIAATLDAKVYENFSDIDRLYSIAPDTIQNPKKLIKSLMK